MTKGVMKFSIFWLHNKQPTLFPQLMHIITTSSGTSSLSMVSSYIILILNIKNTFNKDFKCSSGHSILSAACNIIPWKGNHFMSLIIPFGKNAWLSCQSIYFSLLEGFLFFQFSLGMLLFPGQVSIFYSIYYDQFSLYKAWYNVQKYN